MWPPTEPSEDDELVAHLRASSRCRRSRSLVRRLAELPLTATGKKNYKAVEAAR